MILTTADTLGKREIIEYLLTMTLTVESIFL